ncbi:histidine kinase [Microvirga sp. 17 mud 1-3]|uniref:histidine kinase n=1 Tax=Microvirga sp. 17 mud 1-3 TaxID=2082949 RepID=UPI000D6D05EF|nr:histidine kinase [Microvirga sp. 17 mud 1-3]AWM88277.1 histidine kinase [Microvirga sp. 17 mud 1-3]
MADYYPLIARAVEGLSDQTPEMRRAVYERARTALVAQLRSLDPPLSDADIQKESRSLDDAILRVEADFSAKDFDFDPASLADAQNEGGPHRPEPPAVVPLSAPAAFARDGDEPAEPESAASDAAARPRVETRPHPGMQGGKRGRTIVLGTVLALVIAAIAAFAFLWRDKPEDLTPQTPVAEAPQSQPEAAKNTERVGAPAATPAPAPAPARQEIGVAQRAVLYEEDPANPQAPKAQTGRVVWRLEDINPGQGQPLQRAVTANVDIPDAGLTMKMVLRRNLDATLPASHTVEISFTTRAGDSGRVIRDVGLLQFKDEEAARGTPVAGLPVPVRENLFLIGLSNLSGDVERNTELFVRRNWIDLPVRMASGQRAILSFEKGASGAQVLNSAFSQWQ